MVVSGVLFLPDGHRLEYCMHFPHEITSKLKEKRCDCVKKLRNERFSFNFDVISCGKFTQYSSVLP